MTDPKGIKGWLLLFVIMISLHTLIYLFASILFISNSSFSTLFYLTFLDLIFVTAAIVLTLKKNKIAPIFNIITMIVSIAVTITSYVYRNSNLEISKYLPSNVLSSVIISIIISIIWIFYFIVSKRVKNTFTK